MMMNFLLWMLLFNYLIVGIYFANQFVKDKDGVTVIHPCPVVENGIKVFAFVVIMVVIFLFWPAMLMISVDELNRSEMKDG